MPPTTTTKATANNNKKAAVNPENQGIMEYIRSLSEKDKFNRPSSHYPLLFQRAIKSIQSETTAITTFEEAKKIKHIGTFLASQIVKYYDSQLPQQKQPPTAPPKTDKKQAASTSTSSTQVGNNSNDAADMSDGEDDFSILTDNNNAFSIPTPAQAKELLKKLSTRSKQKGATSNLTPAEINIQKATELSNYLSSSLSHNSTVLAQYYTNFTLVLLMDTRENKSDQVQSKLLQKGIYCEQRTLPIGDMLWIVRGFKKSDEPTTRHAPLTLPDTVEIVLDTIIERKTIDDLMHSLYGTRWNEQRLRLQQHSNNFTGGDGANSPSTTQVIYLIETSTSVQQDCRKSVHSSYGTSNSSAAQQQRQQQQTVQSCIFNTMIQLGFGIIRTRNLDDTISWLRRIHSRILKRYFESPNTQKKISNKSRCLVETPYTTPSFPNPPNINSTNTSLLIYEAYKANIEVARERGTKMTSRIFAAQLKQIQGMSVKRVNAITSMYPTPKALHNAYKNCSNKEEELLIDLPMEGHRKKQRRVGPKCSLELSHVFCLLPQTNLKHSITSVTEENEDKSNDVSVAASQTTLNESKKRPATRTATALDTFESSSIGNCNFGVDDNYDTGVSIVDDSPSPRPTFVGSKRCRQPLEEKKINLCATENLSPSPGLRQKMAMESLIAMGFDDRESIDCALKQHNFNIEAAANQLLGLEN